MLSLPQYLNCKTFRYVFCFFCKVVFYTHLLYLFVVANKYLLKYLLIDDVNSIEKTVKLQNPTTGQTPRLTNWTDTAPIKQAFTVYFVSQSIKRMYRWEQPY